MDSTKGLKDLITLKEAGELLSVHPNTLRKWDANGLLKAVRIGSRGDRRYKKEAVLAFAQRTSYVKNAQEIAQLKKVRQSYFETYADFIIDKARLNSNSIIADVPSWAGGMTQAIQQRGYAKKCYLIDINETLLTAARNTVSPDNTFINGEAKDIDKLIPKPVDAIICLNGFHIYIQKKKQFLKNCYKTLKTDGTLIMDVSTRGIWDEPSRQYLIEEKNEIARLGKVMGTRVHMPTWPDAALLTKYRDMIAAAGFELEETVLFDIWLPVEKQVQETLDIPGRMRPWLPDLDDTQRMTLYRTASNSARKKIGIVRINHNRMFFVVRKKQ